MLDGDHNCTRWHTKQEERFVMIGRFKVSCKIATSQLSLSMYACWEINEISDTSLPKGS